MKIAAALLGKHIRGIVGRAAALIDSPVHGDFPPVESAIEADASLMTSGKNSVNSERIIA